MTLTTPAAHNRAVAVIRRVVLAVLAAAALVAVVAPGVALGAQTRFEVSTFDGSGGDAGAFTNLGRVAVHQASGTVYAIDANAAVVDKFDSSGVAQDYSALSSSSLDGSAVPAPDGPTTFSLGGDADVAVDNSGTASDGNLVVLTSGQQTAWVFDDTGTYLHRMTGFTYPCGAAVDSEGHVWIADYGATAVIEYDASGTATGNSVNTSSQGNPCRIAFDSADNLYVALYNGSVEKYDNTGAHLGQIDAGPTWSVAVDRGDDEVYVVHSGGVTVYDAAGAKLYDFAQDTPSDDLLGIAVNEATDEVYVSDRTGNTVRVFGPPVLVRGSTTGAATDVGLTAATLHGSVNAGNEAVTDCHFDYGTTTAYGQSAPCVPAAASIPSDSDEHAVSADLSGLTAATTYHFRLQSTTASGTTEGYDRTFTTPGASIDNQASRDVDLDSATLTARINPNGQDTTYHFEYGTDTGYGQSTPETPIGSDNTAYPVSATLTGLTPGTTYHWRTVATNASGTTSGPDRAFTTYPPASGSANCPNQRFRTGPAAALPDCRAYEMVSPVDKNNGDIKTLCGNRCHRAALEQSSVDGSKITYSSYKSFGDSLSAPYSSQYLASRGPAGWSTHGLNPPMDGTAPRYQLSINILFRAFSGDLSVAWLTNSNLTSLTPDALLGDGSLGAENLYARDNTDDSYQALTTESGAQNPEFQGRSPDGRHVVFGGDLVFGDDPKLYELSDGGLELVSILPDGTINPENSVLGSRPVVHFTVGPNVAGVVDHAISDDGSRVFWTSEDDPIFAPGGDLYVRIDGERTVAISTTNDARFRVASADGSKVIYETAPFPEGYGSLYEFDVNAETTRLIADQVRGVLGASDDLSHIYYVSKEDLAEGATAGENNLYLEHDGATTFIASLSPADVGFEEDGWFLGERQYNVAPLAISRSSRVTPDGRRVAFQSTRSLTGYDNTDAVSGRADAEVFTYDADSDRLACVSCNPSGARPVGQALRLPYAANDATDTGGGTFAAAAWLTTSISSHYVPRALLDDGSRLFFNSFDALVPQDTNGQQDVYQWEEQGSGSCQKAGGCVDLISSGTSPEMSEFVDASANGSDVFFTTRSSLVPQDTGLIDIYDARVNGGFDPPPAPAAGCEGEACQDGSPVPGDQTPASSGFGGAGNGTRSRKAVGAKLRVVGKAVGGAGFSLRVKVAGKGVITGTGPSLRSVRKRVPRAGAYKLTFKLTSKAKRKLAGKRAPKVSVRVRFVASGGKASQTTLALRLERPQKAHETRAAKNDSGGAK